MVLRTELCELLGIEYPIMLAGMGAVARSDLVAAVSNAGGLGVLGAVGLPLGVKPVLASEGPALELDFTPEIFDRQVEIILEEGTPHFATGLGNPAPYVEEMHRRGMKIISLCGNVKNARRLADAGVHVGGAAGQEARGHTGGGGPR